MPGSLPADYGAAGLLASETPRLGHVHDAGDIVGLDSAAMQLKGTGIPFRGTAVLDKADTSGGTNRRGKLTLTPPDGTMGGWSHIEARFGGGRAGTSGSTSYRCASVGILSVDLEGQTASIGGLFYAATSSASSGLKNDLTQYATFGADRVDIVNMINALYMTSIEYDPIIEVWFS